MTTSMRRKRPTAIPAEPAKTEGRKKLSIRPEVVANARARLAAEDRGSTEVSLIKPPQFPKDVESAIPKIAMDACANSPTYEYLNSQGLVGYGTQSFLGYALLSQLAQQPEYRMITETLAKEMTRKFVKIVSTGSADHPKVKELEKELKTYKIQKLFRRAMEHDGFQGRAHIFVNIKGADASLPLVRDKTTIKKGSLRGFKNIEPVWVYPGNYNSSDPLDDFYFVPRNWYVMSKPVDASRLITIVSREVSDLLKPAYAFGGLSMTQVVMDYVNNWIRTRNSVSDLLHSFSVSILATNLESTLQGDDDGAGLADRAQLFNLYRDNRGLMVIDKEMEDMLQVNTPLSTVDALQAQSQEHMASISHIPLIKLLGVTPSGLNASSDGEIRSFYDWIASLQEDNFTDPMTLVLDLLQLNKYGDIDPDISFEFVPLWQMDDTAAATIRKTNADADAVYITQGVVSPEEVRSKIAADPLSGYAGIDPTELPEPPNDDEDLAITESDPASSGSP